MVDPSNGRARATSKDREQQREHARARDSQSSTQQERGQDASAARRQHQRRVQLLRYIESVDYVLLTREYLIELLEEFPDAMAMIHRMDEDRARYEETGTLDKNRSEPDGSSSPSSSSSSSEPDIPNNSSPVREAQPPRKEENFMFAFIRKHWKKILVILAAGGIFLLCWFWGPTIWQAFKVFMSTPEGQQLMREAVAVVGQVITWWLKK